LSSARTGESANGREASVRPDRLTELLVGVRAGMQGFGRCCMRRALGGKAAAVRSPDGHVPKRLVGGPREGVRALARAAGPGEDPPVRALRHSA
jgi:hypothetical protein